MKKYKSLKRALSLLISAVLTAAFTFSPAAFAFGASSPAPWDGKTIDVSWYSASGTVFHISTPEQLAGLSAIVNGSYNKDITNVIGDASCIINHEEGNTSEGPNNMSSSIYHYGSDDFRGKTIYLDADIDMGGVYNAASDTWSGPNYMPIGGQYLMEKNDSSTKLSSSFNGIFDGQGHTISNIYCDRHCSNGNYGDGSSVGLIGRLGCHDSDPLSMRADTPTVKNVIITGYIYGNRSVGGIVGKIGKSNNGALIENCANFAAVKNTDAKGLGGICGASWNGGTIQNCYNAGSVTSTYTCPAGGIAGSNEISIKNCYNTGTVSAASDSYAMAIGTNNGGGVDVDNCYYLKDSAPGGGYYGKYKGTVTEKTASEMKSTAFVSALGSAFTSDTNNINNGYPILKIQADSASSTPNPSEGSDPSDPSAATPASVDSYIDVSASNWFYDSVKFVTERNLFDAAAPNTFGPDQPMTRQMLVTALYRLAGSPESSQTDSQTADTAGTATRADDASLPFTDVPSNASYAPAVAWAYKNGVVNGVSASSFAPSASITREQIAAMFLRYAQVTGADTTASASLTAYTDTSAVSSWASDAVRWCVGSGLINGTTATTLSPKGTATRAQVAAMVERFAAHAER